jgi:hypothetical protein
VGAVGDEAVQAAMSELRRANARKRARGMSGSGGEERHAYR